MCAGVKDAANLAWKLALCVKNDVGGKILQSYAQERILHVKAYLSTTVCLGELIYSAVLVSALTANFGQELGYSKMKSISPLLGAADFFLSFAHSFKPTGQLLRQSVLSNGLRMDDVYGYSAVLISRDVLEYEGCPVLLVESENSVLPLLD
jgi:3-(3-hydroxy-phenyl)propionate hydroxylase